MAKRYLSIWFPHLLTDWKCIRQPELKGKPLVCAGPAHGRMQITAANKEAIEQGIHPGMALADARAVIHEIEVFDEKQGRKQKLLEGLARWAIRYTPFSATSDDGIMLEVTGCCHLWGGEAEYMRHIFSRLNRLGYDLSIAMADTIGTAWAMARFAKNGSIVPVNQQHLALINLPPAALRLETGTIERLHKLGLNRINRFIQMPRSVLRRRFGAPLLLRVDQAMGTEPEAFNTIELIAEYEERLPCIEPIRTAKAIEIAIEKLLISLCKRLKADGLGIRKALLKSYRIDGKIISSSIGTNQSSDDPNHLVKLFALQISGIAPGMGIELFSMTALHTENISKAQEKLWFSTQGLENGKLAELLDKVEGKVGKNVVRRYLPRADYWPERAYKMASSLTEKSESHFHNPAGRPIQLLSIPERIEVTAPIPDYPPMLFIYQGERHSIKKADGPERLERAWWLEKGEHRDYYIVEDEKGQRYWLFRSGHYAAENSQWFIHGFFA